MKIKVSNIIQNDVCLYTKDAVMLNEYILNNIDNEINISFKGIGIVNYHFLNESIGKLYRNDDIILDKINRNLTISDLNIEYVNIIKNVLLPLNKSYCYG
jgi:hypothetical protein